VVNNLTGWAITTGQVKILSDGSPWRQLVHVEDISTVCIAALESPREVIHDQAIKIGRQGENYQIRDVAEIVGDAAHGSVVTFAEGEEPDPVTTSRLRRSRVRVTDVESAVDRGAGVPPSSLRRIPTPA